MKKATAAEIEAAREMVDGYWRGKEPLSKTPALLSILYDIDLLPEQIRMPVNAARMIAFCEVFRRLSPEQVASLFTPPAQAHVQEEASATSRCITDHHEHDSAAKAENEHGD